MAFPAFQVISDTEPRDIPKAFAVCFTIAGFLTDVKQERSNLTLLILVISFVQRVFLSKTSIYYLVLQNLF